MFPSPRPLPTHDRPITDHRPPNRNTTPGTGEIDVSEIVDLVQQQRKVQIEKGRIIMLALMLFLFLALSLGGNFLLIQQAQRKTADEIEQLPHADASGAGGDSSVALVTEDGKAVSTSDIETYAALLDLPLLGTAELNKIDGITFQTYKGIQHYKITGYTLSKVVDSSNVEFPHLSLKTAFEGVKTSVEVSVAESRAWVLEGSYVTTPIEIGTDSARRKLAEGKAGTGSCLANGACLYSRDELMTLSAESRALLESYFVDNAAIQTYEVSVEDGEDLLAYIRAEEVPMYGEGFTTDDYGFEQMIRIAWSSDFKGLSSTNASDDSFFLSDRNGTYHFDSDGALTWCDLNSATMQEVFDSADPLSDEADMDFDMVFLSKGEVPPADFVPPVPDLEADCMPLWDAYAAANAPSGDDDAGIGDDYADISNTTGRRLFIGSVEEGGHIRTFGNPPDDAKAIHLDADGNEIGEVDAEEMLKENLRLHGYFAGEGEEHLEEHRRLWSGGSASNKELWDITQSAYKGAGMPSGWYHWKTCESGNAHARFIYKYPTMVIGIAGTDGLSDFGDWLDNMDTDHYTTGGRTVHEGFYEYQDKIQSCLATWRNKLTSWNIDVDYIVGHSLGGAAATVFSEVHGREGADLVTFGAPKTRVSSTCTEPGIRFAHESDAVASNGMGAMSTFNHDLQDSKEMYSSSSCSKKFWGVCYKWSTAKTYRDQTCSDESGGCRWLLDCAYYFATVHTAYGDYL